MKKNFKHIRTSIAALRRAFPFRMPRLDPAYENVKIPELPDVKSAVTHYQVSKEYFTSETYLRAHERADWTAVRPEIREFTWKFMRALRARHLPFYVHTAWRDPETQRELRDKGLSKRSLGPHQTGCAVDIVSATHHWKIPDELWYFVGTLGEQVARGSNLEIEWGGRWKFYDPAHWQLKDWRHYSPVKEGENIRLSPYSQKMRF